MLDRELRHLADAAVRHAVATSDGGDHTVAAALLTGSGEIVLGLNAHHFLGGPCGEITALANHAATRPDDPIRAIAAAYGPTAGIVAPCGRCRQVLFDRDPGIVSVVRNANGLTAVPVRELLPHAFDWRTLGAPQRVYLWEGYEQAILDGRKQQTIRVDDPFRAGPAELVFEHEDGTSLSLAAEITDVRTTTRAALTDDDARADGFDDLADLHAALDRHYPGLTADDEVDIVRFERTRR